jgi:hypothetical protein
MQRRSFLAGLLALPAAGVIAREVTMVEAPAVKCSEHYLPTYVSPYLTSKDAWYIKTEHADGIKLYNRTSSRLMTAKQMRELLEPGLNEAFNAIYGSSGL